MTPEVPGLRERKKWQTRRAIRRAALTLFGEQGFAETTVEQIAEAAEVSPRTFYRYFGVKEAVLISADHSPLIVAAFVAAPRHLTPIAAYQYAVTEVFGGMSEEDRHDDLVGQQLLYQVPEAHGLIYAEFIKLIDLITDALQQRLDEPVDETERRVLAGAIAGVIFGAAHNNPLPEKTVPLGLSILDAKLSM
ncbi:TetR family transcriptional regulator [Mycolicibacterium sp. 018/SC-01/001]|uniref:TetR/AcrR family transcriptional regulator n=1 Tax=Mycolicibacterium sp. 018/SC-01/001 TaxID=2592069 RepID=UPI0011814169|nr:TetR/AcrR family transcriptional regulator [Mycolicibacterium sp. 018/SC-01/001]TRW86170.1 TetR family transcriptional regulator [Mycolicibacterium sp. 018/SC-01/001]